MLNHRSKEQHERAGLLREIEQKQEGQHRAAMEKAERLERQAEAEIERARANVDGLRHASKEAITAFALGEIRLQPVPKKPPEIVFNSDINPGIVSYLRPIIEPFLELLVPILEWLGKLFRRVYLLQRQEIGRKLRSEPHEDFDLAWDSGQGMLGNLADKFSHFMSNKCPFPGTRGAAPEGAWDAPAVGRRRRLVEDQDSGQKSSAIIWSNDHG